jgi:5,5'-dehydrodivanillate O-demethylase
MAKRRVDLVHYGPGTPGGNYLRHFWHPVYRSEDLAAGWTKRIEIMGEHFTLYRGEGGLAHVMEDRCPHRKTQLSTGDVEGDDIRCLYHGWKFAADGTCLEQPTEFETFKRKVCIRAYPTREYLGLVFAYLGEGDAPPFPEFPMAEYDNGYPIRVTRVEVKYNFFQRIENSLDEAHVHFVHKTSAGRTNEFAVLPEAFEAEETDYGILRRTIRNRDGKRDVRQKYFMMPNIGLTMPPPATELDDWTAQLSWRVPKNDETTISFVVSRRKPREKVPGNKTWQPADEIVDAILDGRMRLRDVDRFHPRLFNIQDNVAIGGLGRIHDDRESERLGRSDTAIILLRKIFEREICAAMEGKPIKRWRCPEEKLVLGFRPQVASVP